MKFTLSLLLLAVAIGAGCWGCRFHYGTATTYGTTREPVRINRFTGAADILWPGIGWRPVETPLYQIEAAMQASSDTPAAAR